MSATVVTDAGPRIAPVLSIEERQGIIYRNGRRITHFPVATEADTPQEIAPVVVTDANSVALYSAEFARKSTETVTRFALFVNGEFRAAPTNIAAAQATIDYLIGRGFITLSDARIVPMVVSAAL